MASTPESEREHDCRQYCHHSANGAERGERPTKHIHPSVERHQNDDKSRDGRDAADKSKTNRQTRLFDLFGYLTGGPRPELLKLRANLGKLTVEVNSEKAHHPSQHQPRPRMISPITIPTASAPARAPSGFLRATSSNSVAKVLS